MRLSVPFAVALAGAALAACAADTFAGTDGGAGDAGGQTCPNLAGRYDVNADGQGCPTTSIASNLCVQQIGCTIKINDQGLATTLDIGPDGSFSGAAVNEGSIARSGCTGTWDASQSQLTIVCGGVNTSQSCVVTLTRTSNTCN